ncbi:MAG: hypothetical protein RR814_02990 [Oscillospiraceae bacterium]
MKKNVLKRISALALSSVLLFSLAACGKKANSEPTIETDVDQNLVEVLDGGSINMPEGFEVPVEAGSMNAVITESGMAGAFTLIRNRTTDYFSHSGSITINVNSAVFALANDVYVPKETKHQEASAALWKKGDGVATYIGTAFFKADGTTQNATFANLDPAAEYRVAFNYSDYGSYRMTGTFNISGVTGAEPASVSSSAPAKK